MVRDPVNVQHTDLAFHELRPDPNPASHLCPLEFLPLAKSLPRLLFAEELRLSQQRDPSTLLSPRGS